jgi:phosphatidylglycerophosphatase A
MTRARGARSWIAWTIATWFGCGLLPLAPGTFGTLGALPVYLVAREHGPAAVLAAAAIVTAVGVWASGIVATESGEKDPQRVVVDEAAGVLLALAWVTPSWGQVTMAVLLFRLFDVVKPFPARDAERLHGGWGVVVDDLVAGAWAAVATRLLGHLVAN